LETPLRKIPCLKCSVLFVAELLTTSPPSLLFR
jgi:hypothetical protein